MKVEVKFKWLFGTDGRNKTDLQQKKAEVKLRRKFEDDCLSCGVEEYSSCGELLFYSQDTTLNEVGIMGFDNEEAAKKAISKMNRINRFYDINLK